MIWDGFVLIFKTHYETYMMKFTIKTPRAKSALVPVLTLATTLAIAVPILFSSYAEANTVALDEVIVIVNDEAITRSEYQTRYKRQQIETDQGSEQIPEQVDNEILERLIDERIQAQVAHATGVVISRAEVESTLGNMAAQNNFSQAQLIAELEGQGISEAQFLRSIEEQILIQRLIDISVTSRVAVSDQEVDYYLQTHKERYNPSQIYELSHLFVATAGKSATEIEHEAENITHIYQGLLQGQSFAKAVKDFSDSENKENGGYMGWRKEQQLPELFLTALRQTPVGGVTQVVQSPNGFHIIKLHAQEREQKIVTQQFVRHILIQPQREGLTDRETIDKLDEVANKIRQGGDFAKFARLISDDITTAHQGGLLDWVSPGDTAPRFEQAALSLPLNQMSAPVQTRFGYHIIEVLARREKDISSELARKNARRDLFTRKAAERYQNWFGRLREGAYIEYLANN